MHATFDGVKIYWKCFEKANRPAGRIESKRNTKKQIWYCLGIVWPNYNASTAWIPKAHFQIFELWFPLDDLASSEWMAAVL